RGLGPIRCWRPAQGRAALLSARKPDRRGRRRGRALDPRREALADPTRIRRCYSCPAMDYEQRRADALIKLAAGDPQAAFGLFRGCVSFPERLEPERWADAFGILAQLVEAIAGEPLAGQITAIARDRENLQALYDAGYALHEAGLYEIAACVLASAVEQA